VLGCLGGALIWLLVMVGVCGIGYGDVCDGLLVLVRCTLLRGRGW
jgi:hypothetical protein